MVCVVYLCSGDVDVYVFVCWLMLCMLSCSIMWGLVLLLLLFMCDVFYFTKTFCQDMQGMITDGSVLATELAPLGKGAGKGDLGKGGKGKGKAKPPGAPQPTEPKSEEELLEEAFCKVRRMRDCCSKVMSDMEETLNSLKKSKFWSKAAQKDAMQYIIDMDECMKDLKKALLKKSVTLEDLKKLLCTVATKVKECQMQLKEYKQLANKTLSKASK